MKTVAIILTLLSISQAFALSGKTPPRNDGSGLQQCAWYDEGSTEEHGPHSTQQECVAAHGTCQQRCYIYEQVCKVDGVIGQIVVDEKGNKSIKENITTFTGRDQDYRRAEEKALHACYESYPRQDVCRQSSCYEDAVRVR